MQLVTKGVGAAVENDLELARAILFATKGATCVAVCGDDMLVSFEPGVKPLLKWIAEGKSLAGYSVADKVVGKAAALLYAMLGPAAVFAPVMSEPARAVLVSNAVAVGYDSLVERIMNHEGTRQCPLDSAVANIFDPYEAEAVICEQLELIELAAALA